MEVSRLNRLLDAWRADVLQCMDGRNLVAVWDLSHPEHEHHATLSIKPAGLLFVTEILTTLILNRMAQDLNWC